MQTHRIHRGSVRWLLVALVTASSLTAVWTPASASARRQLRVRMGLADPMPTPKLDAFRALHKDRVLRTALGALNREIIVQKLYGGPSQERQLVLTSEGARWRIWDTGFYSTSGWLYKRAPTTPLGFSLTQFPMEDSWVKRVTEDILDDRVFSLAATAHAIKLEAGLGPKAKRAPAGRNEP